MSRASTEFDNAVNTMCHAVDREVFTYGEVSRMFARMLQNMNVAEMNKMIADCTRFYDLDDVEFTLDVME
jgi:hypothetical protein